MTWDESDGWVLASVMLAQCQQGSRLVDIIAAADVLNHSIPSEEQLSSSLSKLATAGIVSSKKKEYTVCEDHHESLIAAMKEVESMFDSSGAAQSWLEEHGKRTAKKVVVSISRKELDAAHKKYSESTS